MLGKYCEKLGIDKYIFDKILKKKKFISKVLLSDGALLELEMGRSKQNSNLEVFQPNSYYFKKYSRYKSSYWRFFKA